MTDDDLVSRAKAGEAEAWRELYRAHAGRLVAWLQTRPDSDAAVSADDLASEAWLVAAEKIPEFSGSSSDFAGWLFSIARNISWNSARRANRRQTSATDHEHDEAATGTEQTSEVEANSRIRYLLSGLSPRERDVVGCIDGLGFDVPTTAAALEISAVAVRVARHRGLRRLRKMMERGGRPESESESESAAG